MRKYRKRKRNRGKKQKKFTGTAGTFNLKLLSKMLRVSNANRTYTCIVAATQSLGTTIAGNYAFAFTLNHPTYWVNGAGTFQQMGGVTTAWARLITVFDMYKVLGLRVSFLPNFVDTASTSTDIPAEIYLYHDRDDAATGGTDAINLQDGIRSRGLAIGKPQSFMIGQRANIPYLNISTIGVVGSTNVTQASVTMPSNYESIKAYFPNLIANANYGRFFVQWIVRFSGQNTLN